MLLFQFVVRLIPMKQSAYASFNLLSYKPYFPVRTGTKSYEVLSWSPDGKKIAFLHQNNGNAEIYVINADGSNPTKVTNDPNSTEGAVWSPDGKKIAYFSRPEPYKKDGYIYVINADGSGKIKLTDTEFSQNPIWSPDGMRIAFNSERDGNVDIYVINADGSRQTKLTTNPGRDSKPVWSPNGQQIAYECLQDEKSQICLLK